MKPMIGIAGSLILLFGILAVVKPATKAPGAKAWFADLYKLFQLVVRLALVAALITVAWVLYHSATRS